MSLSLVCPVKWSAVEVETTLLPSTGELTTESFRCPACNGTHTWRVTALGDLTIQRAPSMGRLASKIQKIST